jgi:very-short-patch-repair endonuclease
MVQPPSREVPDVAGYQHGVFTRAQAYDEGWTARQVRRRVTAGRWRVFAGAALCHADQEIGPWQLAFAVDLTWPVAAISHQLAGVLRGFPVALGPVGTCTVPRNTHVQAPGLRAYRSRLLPADIGMIGGLRATTETRTAVDLLATLPWSDARDLWAWLATRRLMTLDDLRVAAAGRTGQPGTPQLRRLVTASASGSLSAAEDLLHDLLRKAGIGGWVANARVVAGNRVIGVADVLFEGSKVVIEVDGWRTHSSRSMFQADRTKQNALVLAGYVVLRVTWADLTERPAAVVRQVRESLALRSRSTQ